MSDKQFDICDHIDTLTDVEQLRRMAKAWVETAAQHARNEDYYRSLVQRCGKAAGQRAYTQDDGNIVPDVLCAKVPEVVEAIVAAAKDMLLAGKHDGPCTNGDDPQECCDTHVVMANRRRTALAFALGVWEDA